VSPLIQFARNYEILGDTGKQFARANEAHRLLAGLAAEKPDRTYQGDLAIAYDEVGDVLAERLAKADRSNTQWQRDLAISHSKSASV
jgi:hypothetical protein